jgi:hypothetical protein
LNYGTDYRRRSSVSATRLLNRFWYIIMETRIVSLLLHFFLFCCLFVIGVHNANARGWRADSSDGDSYALSVDYANWDESRQQLKVKGKGEPRSVVYLYAGDTDYLLTSLATNKRGNWYYKSSSPSSVPCTVRAESNGSVAEQETVSAPPDCMGAVVSSDGSGGGSTDPASGTTDPVTASRDPASDTTDPVTASTDPVTASTDPVTDTTDPASDATDPASGTTDPVTASTDPVTASTDPATDTTDPATDTTDPVTANTDPATASTDPATDTTDPVTASTDPVTAASGSGSVTSPTGSAVLSWVAPTTRTDGSPLSPGEVAGFRIYHGTDSGNLTLLHDLSDGSATSYTVTGLQPATHYFVVTDYDYNANESAFSAEVSKTLP